MATCTYCGSDLADYSPVVVVAEETAAGREEAGQFCNYACLVAHVEAERLETGACCHLSTAQDPS